MGGYRDNKFQEIKTNNTEKKKFVDSIHAKHEWNEKFTTNVQQKKSQNFKPSIKL